MHALFLRPLLVVLTLFMLSVALVQSVGRVGFAVLDDLELAVNQWLSASRVRVHGLSGSWRLMNPMVSMERLDFPAGYLTDVTVEFDWLESLIRNRLVTRRLFIAQGNVELVPNGSGGWRLRGAAGEQDLDLSGLLYHSDQVQVTAGLTLISDHATHAYALDYLAINRGGRHRHRLMVTGGAGDAASCADPCQTRFELEAREGLWPLWEDDIQVHATVDRMQVPTSLSGVGAFLVSELTFDWYQRQDDSGGTFSLRLDEVTLPGDVVASAELNGRVAGVEGHHDGVIDELRIFHQRPGIDEVARWDLPEMRLRVEPDYAEVWAGSLDLAQASQFLAGALAGSDRISRWLRELNVDATALNARGRLNWSAGTLDYGASLADLSLDGYRGVPYLRGGAGELIGHRRAVQFSLNAQNLLLQFPETFRDRWDLAYAQGVLQMWFKDGYLGLRGPSVRLRTADHRIWGGFSISRPPDRSEERLTLLAALDDVDLDQARSYVPYTVSEGLRQWLKEGPREGTLVQPRLAYLGHMHGGADELHRRVELSTGLQGTRVRYHTDWPEVERAAGRLVLGGSRLRVELEQGSSAGARLLSGSRVVLTDNAANAHVNLIADVSTADILDFIRVTPLKDSLKFVEEQWAGSGNMSLVGSLQIPLDDEAPDALQLDLTMGLEDAGFVMPELRLSFADLNGEFRYRYPNSLMGSGIRGSLFGRPALISARPEADYMVLRVEGAAEHTDVLRVLDMNDVNVARGQIAFVADLYMGVRDDDITRLQIQSDLVGAQLMLPGEFAKAAEVARPLDVTVQFFDTMQVVSFSHAGARGWLHLEDQPVRGGVGFDVAPPGLDAAANHLVLTGALGGFALDDVVPESGDGTGVRLPVKLANLRVGAIDVGDFRIDDAVLNGEISSDGFAINLASQTIGGNFSARGDEPLQADIDYIALPEPQDDGADPLSVDVIPDLPEAHVALKSLRVGALDYGRWRFDMVPEASGVRFKNIDAQLRGLDIQAPEGVLWRAGDNVSHFVGEVHVGNLADVLPHWDYAPSLETQSGLFVGDVTWRGSPANVELERLAGTAEISAKNGRFADVESGGGALRIFSLMNFNAIAKRMRGDFSDVTGKGLAFEDLGATVRFDEGTLEFVESLKVSGTGSRFEVGGTVDLVAGTLNNEMIVTLPVNKSLPWYGVYLALANPLAGAGIIVGERVLRKPLEQFSSAKYQIGGTIDEPTLTLVSVFDTSMQEAEPDAALPEQEPALDNGPNAAKVAEEVGRPEI